jgi:hypothetical protein
MSEGFTVNDKRARPSRLITGQTVAQAKTAQQQADAALSLGRQGRAPTDYSQVMSMKSSRRRAAKTALSGGGGSAAGGSSISIATNRPHDPMFYWRQNNLPYDANDPEQLIRLRDLCRLLYQTHPLLASAIDIFSRWPVVGMEFVGKDEELNQFYSELFIEQLDYESYLTDIGREYWTIGEAFPLGSFNEDLGVWENDELINPNDVFVENSPFLTESHFYLRLPETLREILRSGQPVAEYRQLMQAYPELLEYKEENARMPVSNMLMSHLRFKGNTFNPRGVPILLRGLRAVIQEEMLNAAQDAIADRLYTPLILARVGATAQELGTEEPWIPTDDQLADFEDAVDTALAADFRLLTTHFAVQMESVFGRENMPNLDADFERLAERQLQVFGLSKSMLSGSASGDTYASNALNRDLVSQLLQTYQKQLQRFVKQRMLIVAEAQEHFDYEEHNGEKRVIMEEVLVRDPESGEQKIVERPKLLVPELRLATMNLSDQSSEREFLEALRSTGVPISQRTRAANAKLDLEEETEISIEEQVEQAVAAQKVRMETFRRLREENLPIPDDLMADFSPTMQKADEMEGSPTPDAPAPGVEPPRLPTLGVDTQPHTDLAPTPAELMVPPDTTPGEPAAPVAPAHPGAPAPASAPAAGKLPTNKSMNRPAESDEMRASMPKPTAKVSKKVMVDGVEVTKEIEVTGALISGPHHMSRERRHTKARPNLSLPSR